MLCVFNLGLREKEKKGEDPSAVSIFKYYSTSMSSRRKLNKNERNRYHHSDETDSWHCECCLCRWKFFNNQAIDEVKTSGENTHTKFFKMVFQFLDDFLMFLHTSFGNVLKAPKAINNVAIISADYLLTAVTSFMF
jgi:hypothetical protein